jgi:hypothetical protein
MPSARWIGLSSLVHSVVRGLPGEPRMRIGMLWALGALLATGCGGKVVFEESSGAGGSSVASSASTGDATVGASSGVGGASACPKEAPVAGATCSTPGLTCALPYECCDPAATCTNGIWVISAPDCQSLCIPCGPIECAGNAVCVSTHFDAFIAHKCEANPCVDQALSCSCAAPLCSAAGECTSASASQVGCETFTD